MVVCTKNWHSLNDPLTLWLNWCGPRGSAPDPQGQSGDPEGPAAKARVLLTSKERNCAYRQTHPGDPFCWSTGSVLDPQGPTAGPQGPSVQPIPPICGEPHRRRLLHWQYYVS